MKLIYCVLFLFTVVAFGASIGVSQDYMLGEGDVVTVTVYEQPGLKTTARVSGDGRISLPLIGQVTVADMGVDRIAGRIEALLADGYIVNPQVNIFIEEFRSRKATILGEIDSQGVYEIRGQTSLLELISLAGGLTGDAMDSAIIHRNPAAEEGEETITVNLRQLLRKGGGDQNIRIVNGDNIYIPKKETFYVTGEVKKPDSYNYESGLKVIQALTMAGGVTDKASERRIRIIRTHRGGEQLLKGVGMDQSVRPNDIIVVPESFF